MISGVAANGANWSSQTAGSINVLSNGTDTYFFVQSITATTVMTFAVTGKDLVTTTAVGLVNNTSANFGFTVAANSGTAGAASATGVNITLI